MPTQRTDSLVSLINSMSKAEKRSFKLFVTRNQKTSGEILFLKLFDEINKKGSFSESEVLTNIPGIKKRQLSNLKAHLYKQLLVSLRTLKSASPDVAIRESITNAEILYCKGLYTQALEIYAKTKERAKHYHQHDQLLVILNKEKYIESQHITHAHPNRVESLSDESKKVLNKLEQVQKLSDLSLTLYSKYLNTGYVKTAEQARQLSDFVESKIKSIEPDLSDFYSKILYNQSYAWYYFIQQDFANYYKHCLRWQAAFDEFPHMMEIEEPLYIKGLHNTLTSLFMANAPEKFEEYFDELKSIAKSDSKKSWNVLGLANQFYFTHLLNSHMMQGRFTACIPYANDLQKLLRKNTYNWDQYRVMMFHYKCACVFFGASEFSRSVDFLNRIINQKTTDLRTDIQCYARILALISHYELGSRKLLEYQVKSVYRFLSKMDELQKVQQAVFRFVRKIPNMKTLEVKDHFRQLRDELVEIAKDPFERRSFLYLDIISWLESKLEKRSVEDVIRQKYLRKREALMA